MKKWSIISSLVVVAALMAAAFATTGCSLCCRSVPALLPERRRRHPSELP